MSKIVNTALKAKAKAWTAKAKAKATGPEAKAKATGPEAKAKAIKFGLEAPRGQGLASRTTSLSAVVIRIIEVGFNISHSNTPLHYTKVVAMYLQNSVVLCVVHYQLIMSYSVQLPEIFGRTMMKIVNKLNENLLIDRTRLEVSDVLQLKKHSRSWILVRVTQLFIINLNCGTAFGFKSVL